MVPQISSTNGRSGTARLTWTRPRAGRDVFCGKIGVSVGSQTGQHAVCSSAYTYPSTAVVLVCLHEGHIVALRELWTDGLPTDKPTVIP